MLFVMTWFWTGSYKKRKAYSRAAVDFLLTNYKLKL